MSPSLTPLLSGGPKLGAGYVQDMIQLAQQVNSLLQMHRCLAGQTAVQAIPNAGAFTALVFDTAPVYDVSTQAKMHSATVNNTRFTAQAEGFYEAQGQLALVGDVTGSYRLIRVYVNGAAYTPLVQTSCGGTTGGITLQVSVKLPLKYGDYVEFKASHDGTGSINTAPTACWGSLTLLSRL